MNTQTNEIYTGKELLSPLYNARDVIREEETIESGIVQYEKNHELLLNQKKDIEDKVGVLAYLVGLIIAFLGLGIFSIIGAVIGFIIGFFIGTVIDTTIFGNKRSIKALQLYNNSNIILDQQKNQLANQASELCSSNRYTMAHQVIPPDYCDSESISYILKLIENGRADSIKEAFNMYEDFLHKKRLEDMQYNQMVAAQESTIAQKEIAKNSKELTKAVQNQASHMEELSRNSNKIAKNTKSTARATKLNTFVNIVKK
jgi:hypothetical protein